MRLIDLAAVAFCVAGLAACSPPAPETPAEAPPPAVNIQALNTMQMAEIITQFAPPGTLCTNAGNAMGHGVVPADAAPAYAAHVGAVAYSAHCIHTDLPNDAEALGQQWMLFVTAAEPWAATVVPCWEAGQDWQYDTICWKESLSAAPATP
jgi:hypothetical protein